MIEQIDTPGGYSDKIFVGEVDADLICPICQEVLKDPHQIKCGHMHCKSCWEDLPTKNIHGDVLLKCSLCSEETKIKNLSPCRFAKNYIHKLPIKCEKISNSACGWIGTLSELSDHQTKCQFQLPKNNLNQQSNHLQNGSFYTINPNNSIKFCSTYWPTPFLKRIVQQVVATHQHNSAFCSLQLQLVDETITISVNNKIGRLKRIVISWSDLFVRLYRNFFPRIVGEVLNDALKDSTVNIFNFGFNHPSVVDLRDMMLYYLWGDLVSTVLHIWESGPDICHVPNENFDVETMKSIVKMSNLDHLAMQTLLTTTLDANKYFLALVELFCQG
jgi:hypothetical protein